MGVPIHDSNTIPLDDVSEVGEKPINKTFFSFVFGFVMINAVIILRLPITYIYF